MIVLNDVVPCLSVCPVPEHSLEQGGRIDAEAERSYYDNDVVTGRNGKHINVPPNGIEGCRLIMQPQAHLIVNNQESKIVNGSQYHFVPLHPQVF